MAEEDEKLSALVETAVTGFLLTGELLTVEPPEAYWPELAAAPDCIPGVKADVEALGWPDNGDSENVAGKVWDDLNIEVGDVMLDIEADDKPDKDDGDELRGFKDIEPVGEPDTIVTELEEIIKL